MAAPIEVEIDRACPLVLDVDGTLLRTDLRHESFWAALGHDAPATVGLCLRHWKTPALLKHALLAIAVPKIDLLPERPEVLALARRAAAEGRAVHIVSEADQALVDAVADRFALPGDHHGSTPGRDLTGETRAALLVRRFGTGGYDYAGSSAADMAAWRTARRIVAVAPGRALRAGLEKLGKPVEVLGDGWRRGELLRELRLHQWLKNLLLFLPLLAAQSFGPGALGATATAFAAFGFGASALYILNDLLDLEADRRHPEKFLRPVASGRLPIRTAMGASGLLAGLSWALSLSVSPAVWAMTATYMVLSLCYSLWLKKHRWIDLMTLAGLFVVRVLTGSVASGVAVSGLLLAGVFAFFISLACVKRLTALARGLGGRNLPGRSYGLHDFDPLKRLAALGGIGAGGLFAGFAFSPAAAGAYTTPGLLALAILPLGVWLGRVIRMSIRGQEDYDPVIFVTRDRRGLGLLLLSAVLVLLAI